MCMLTYAHVCSRMLGVCSRMLEEQGQAALQAGVTAETEVESALVASNIGMRSTGGVQQAMETKTPLATASVLVATYYISTNLQYTNILVY